MIPFRWRWPGVRKRASVAMLDDAPAPPDVDPSETSLTSLLSEIEAAARAVYVRHGLPAEPGQYARSAKAGKWRYLSDSLTAEERWALVLAQKPGSGWRFASLPDLGDQSDSPPEVRLAARVLRSCHQLHTRRRSGVSPDAELELSIRLGADWLQLERERAASSPGPKKPARTRAKARPAT